MSSFDVLAVARELQSLKDARINKVFQVTRGELKITLTPKGLGKAVLLIEAGRRVHLTEYPKPSPKRASTFAMTMRKHIENSHVRNVQQIAFDRILEIGRNQDGLFYNQVNPITGEILNDGIADTWGYTFNAYLTVYQIDKREIYSFA